MKATAREAENNGSAGNPNLESVRSDNTARGVGDA